MRLTIDGRTCAAKVLDMSVVIMGFGWMLLGARGNEGLLR
jgi:hypothetical protein